jgi:hypothetical protein
MKIIHKPYNKIRAQKSYSFSKKIIIIIIIIKTYHCIFKKPTKTRSKCKQRMKEKGSEQRDIPPWQQDSTPFTREAS